MQVARVMCARGLVESVDLDAVSRQNAVTGKARDAGDQPTQRASLLFGWALPPSVGVWAGAAAPPTCQVTSHSPAAARSSSARSVFSQGASMSVRPKWP